MTSTRAEILAWVQATSQTLGDASRAETREFQQLNDSERWSRVRAACIGAGRFVTAAHQERLERRVAADHRRWNEVVDRVRSKGNARPE